MESKPAVEVYESTTSADWAAGLLALVSSVLGLVLCFLMAFGLMALPVLAPLHMYTFIGLRGLDLWALIIGAPGPLPAALGIGLGWWARWAGRRRGASTRLAAAITVGLIALALTALAWAANEHVARTGRLF